MNRKLLKELLVKLWFFLLPLQSQRSRFLRKHDILDACGENVFFQPRKLPADPKCIRLHNNVFVAADVRFVCHDVIFLMLRNMDSDRHCEHLGCIEVMDNCFLGQGSTILSGVRIGPNAVIAAGSVVTHDVPEGTVVAGVPARVIGSFRDLVEKQNRESASVEVDDIFAPERIRQAWTTFDQAHGK